MKNEEKYLKWMSLICNSKSTIFSEIFNCMHLRVKYSICNGNTLS